MGADLICFILKGPEKLDVKLTSQAIKKGRATIYCVQEIVNANSTGFFADFEKALDKIDLRPLLHLLHPSVPVAKRKSAIIGLEPEDTYEYLLNLDPKNVCQDFMDLWSGKISVRDTYSRLDPDNRKKQIMVAGELSWGEEPSGTGYQTLKAAIDLGIASTFKVT